MSDYDIPSKIEEFKESFRKDYKNVLPDNDPIFRIMEFMFMWAKELHEEHEHIIGCYRTSMDNANLEYLKKEEEAEKHFEQSLKKVTSELEKSAKGVFREALIEAMAEGTKRANINVADQIKKELGSSIEQNKFFFKINVGCVIVLAFVALLMVWLR